MLAILNRTHKIIEPACVLQLYNLYLTAGRPSYFINILTPLPTKSLQEYLHPSKQSHKTDTYMYL